MTIGMALEMLGVGLVVPAMAALSGAQSSGDSATLTRIRDWLGNPADGELVILGLVVLGSVYAVKAAFLVFLAWQQARFVADLSSGLSNRLFAAYLRQPWTFHLQRNSAALMHSITVELQQFSILCSALLSFVTELLVITGISGLLLYYEPIVAVVSALVLASASWLFHYFTRSRIKSWGVRHRENSILRTKHLHQGLHGVKDVKMLGREADFLARFQVNEAVAVTMGSRLVAAQQMPRLWYELLAVAGLGLVASVLVWQGEAGPRLLARLALFAAAAFRMMPSANRLLLTWQSLVYYKPAIDSVYAELAIDSAQEQPNGPALQFKTVIEVSGASFRYPGAASEAIDDVNLRIAQGQAFGVIGGSGAGKSTLVDMLLGLLSPDSGAVLVDGVDIRTNLRSWQALIGYVPQTIYLTDDTVAANVAFGVPAGEVDLEAVRRALRAAQLEDFVAGLPEGIDTFVGERGVRLSGGQRQRIGIARALYRDPPVLVLDEATSSLDTETEKSVMNAVNRLHGVKTLIIVAHRLSTVAECDDLIRLERGKVVKSGVFTDVTAGAG